MLVIWFPVISGFLLNLVKKLEVIEAACVCTFFSFCFFVVVFCASTSEMSQQRDQMGETRVWRLVKSNKIGHPV